MAPHIGTKDILWYESLESTNSELRKRVGSLDNLSIVAAKSQTSGRGQGDHKWFSTPDTNLTFSILLKFKPGELKAVDEQIINSFATPSIRSFLAEEGVESWVKQPNDIYVGDRKICGILVETVLEGPWVIYSIVGIGLNINQENFPDDLPNPISLFQLTGKKYPLEQTLERIHDLCKKNWDIVFRHS